MPRISISLITLSHRADLEQLLPVLVPAARRADAEVLVVDNRSTDGSVEFLRTHYPEVRITPNPRRAGYGENHNCNLKHARGQYFVVMNSDVTVGVDTFAALAALMDKRPEVGIVAPKVLNPDGTVQGLNKREPTILDLGLRRFWPARWKRFVQHRLDRYEMRDIGYDVSCDVPFLSGAFMFCRTEVLRAVGGFDERFFLYFEDADLCRRVQRTHRTVYCPDVTITHFWERGAHKRARFAWYFIRSAFQYFNRWGYRWV